MRSTRNRRIRPELAIAHVIVVGVLLAPQAFAAGPGIEGLRATEAFRLRAALRIAQRQLKHHIECERLFLELDAEGPDLLLRARFRPADLSETRQICGTGSVAMFTTVGGE